MGQIQQTAVSERISMVYIQLAPGQNMFNTRFYLSQFNIGQLSGKVITGLGTVNALKLPKIQSLTVLNAVAQNAYLTLKTKNDESLIDNLPFAAFDNTLGNASKLQFKTGIYIDWTRSYVQTMNPILTVALSALAFEVYHINQPYSLN